MLKYLLNRCYFNKVLENPVSIIKTGLFVFIKIKLILIYLFDVNDA